MTPNTDGREDEETAAAAAVVVIEEDEAVTDEVVRVRHVPRAGALRRTPDAEEIETNVDEARAVVEADRSPTRTRNPKDRLAKRVLVRDPVRIANKNAKDETLSRPRVTRIFLPFYWLVDGRIWLGMP